MANYLLNQKQNKNDNYNKTIKIKNENTILIKKSKRDCTYGHYVVHGIMRKEQERRSS